MKIHEFVTMLQQYHPMAEVIGTWEGEEEDIDVYQAADGRVVVDVDGNFYKVQWQESKCEICGESAAGSPFYDKAVCFKHWRQFKGKP